MKRNYLLLDYDGTLGISEHLAFTACCSLVNDVLASWGCELRFTVEKLLDRFVGWNFRRMISVLAEEQKKQLDPKRLEELVIEEEDRVIARLSAELQPCEHANEILATLTDRVLAVVTSSALRRVRACLTKADQERFFKPEYVFSAASSLAVPASKPNPAIYLHAMEKIGAKPGECDAVEDSKSGVAAAVAAGLKDIVGYLGSYPKEERARVAAILKEAAACGDGVRIIIIEDWNEFPAALATIEEDAK
jgi:HAD superfamily hydrolase (TIGR01509 family)